MGTCTRRQIVIDRVHCILYYIIIDHRNQINNAEDSLYLSLSRRLILIIHDYVHQDNVAD